MRNKIIILDPPKLEPPSIESLPMGSLFAYIGGDRENIYMKGDGNIIHLPTGKVYASYNHSGIYLVKSVNIVSQ